MEFIFLFRVISRNKSQCISTQLVFYWCLVYSMYNTSAQLIIWFSISQTSMVLQSRKWFFFLRYSPEAWNFFLGLFKFFYAIGSFEKLHEICLETGQIGFCLGSNQIIVWIFVCKLSRKPFLVKHVSSSQLINFKCTDLIL